MHHAAFKLCNIPHLSSCLEISCYCHYASVMNSEGYCNGQHLCIFFPQPLTAIYKSSLLPPQPLHKITHYNGNFLMENKIIHHSPSCSETLNIYLVQNEGGMNLLHSSIVEHRIFMVRNRGWHSHRFLPNIPQLEHGKLRSSVFSFSDLPSTDDLSDNIAFEEFNWILLNSKLSHM